MENLLQASGKNETRQEAPMKAELFTGFVEVVWSGGSRAKLLMQL